MIENRRSHSRLFYRYLISYMSVVILIIGIIAFVLFSTSIRTLRHEAERSGMAVLKSAVYEVEALITEMRQISIQIMSNPLFAPYLLSHDVSRQIEATRLLKFYQAANTYCEEIALFYGSSPDTLYSSGGVIGLEAFFNTRYQFQDWNEQSFRREIRSMTGAELRATSSVLEFGSAEKRFLTYIVPFPTNVFSPYGACLFLLDVPSIENIFANLLHAYKGYAVISDADHSILFEVSPDHIRYTAGSRSQPHNAHGDNGKYTFLEVSSDFGYTFSVALLNTRLFEVVDRNRVVLICTITALAVLGFAMTYFFSSILYKPIRELAATTMEDGKEITNELTAIATRITSMSVENNNLRNMLDRGTALVKERLILSLLYTDDEYGAVPFDLARIDFPFGRFVVMIAMIADGSEKSEVVRFSLASVWEEMAKDHGFGVCQNLVDLNAMGMIYNCDGDVYEKAESLAEGLVDFFKGSFGIELSVAVGEAVQDIHGIHDSFQCARRVLEYRLIFPERKVFMYTGIERPAPVTGHFYPVAEEREIIKYVRAGMSREAEICSREIVHNVHDQHLSPELLKGLLISVLNAVVKSVECEHVPEVQAELVSFLSSSFDSSRRIDQDFVKTVSHLAECFKEKSFSAMEDTLSRISAFIEEHFGDYNLSLKFVSHRFGLSPSYLTRLFKRHTGYSLKEYIDYIRIREARSLLCNTDRCLAEIVEATGFQNKSNFCRKFKQMEGVSPLTYRSMNTPADESPHF